MDDLAWLGGEARPPEARTEWKWPNAPRGCGEPRILVERGRVVNPGPEMEAIIERALAVRAELDRRPERTPFVSKRGW